MTADLKSLAKQRTVLKAQITRIKNYVTDTEDLEIHALELRKQKLEDLFERLCSVQTEIENVDDSPGTAARVEFETLYYECGDLIGGKLYRLSNRSLTTAPVNNISAASPTIMTNQTILPKIHIKPFDGNFIDWQGFFDTFRSLVHENDSIPIVHKFHLLKSYLTGNASSAINSLIASEENYFVAWELIQKRFNNPRKIIQSHIRALFELPENLKYSPSALRALSEAAEMHINALKALNQPVDWDEMLIYIITSKLDRTTRTSWERTIEENVMPKFKDLLAFINRYSRDDEPVKLVSQYHDNPQQRDNNYKKQFDKPYKLHKTNTFVSAHSSITCALCKQAHYINQCKQFLSQTPYERLKLIKGIKHCVNCFHSNHTTVQCRASTCRKCGAKHHTLLHFEPSNNNNKKDTTVDNAVPSTSTSIALTAYGISEVLLSTAQIIILDANNKEHNCRVLLDPGSQSNFITEKFANKLKLPRRKINLPVLGLGQQANQVRLCVQSRIKSRITRFSCDAKFLILPNIMSNLPSRRVERDVLNIPSNVKLADPDFNIPANIDALLGEYLFYKLLRSGRIRLNNKTAVLQETQLGWVISGEVRSSLKPINRTNCFLTTVNLDKQLQRFWELEEILQKRLMSREEKLCELSFQDTTQRDSSGHFIVRLPFNDRKGKLGDSYKIALKRFYAMERKLQLNTKLREKYVDFLEEYPKKSFRARISRFKHQGHGF
ncbi:uncharacterized protein LOC143342806 [Colletes latitarsis]|uniref:uncharacterized protein LOC143342806 n=1 Tax=Colletes latitarsis TaxID=2605962 RepID=UPI004036148D